MPGNVTGAFAFHFTLSLLPCEVVVITPLLQCRKQAENGNDGLKGTAQSCGAGLLLPW